MGYYIRNDISAAAVNHPSRAVEEFCRVPISRYFTTRAIPGLQHDWRLTSVLKDKYDIKNPMDFVAYLRFSVRGRGRLRRDLMASILADFLEEVCVQNGLEMPHACRTVSICIAIMESKLPWANEFGVLSNVYL